MKVKLPRPCTGQEIVDAFAVAGSFQPSPENRLEAGRYNAEIQYHPGSVRQVVHRMGVHVSALCFKKRFVFWGKKVWKLDPSLKISLEPLVLGETYDEVDLNLEFYYDYDQGGFASIATNPIDPGYEKIRETVERIIGSFYSGLTPQPTAS